MAEFLRGARAGAVSQVISGIISIILSLFILQVTSSEFQATIVVYAASIITASIYGLIGGIILGLIFAAVYNYLPGDNSIIKGIIFSLVFWIFWTVLNPSTTQAIPLGAILFIGIISSTIGGILLGKLWDRRI